MLYILVMIATCKVLQHSNSVTHLCERRNASWYVETGEQMRHVAWELRDQSGVRDGCAHEWRTPERSGQRE